MLGFTLSKINLMIFAIATAATLLFFMFILTNILEAQAAQQVVARLSSDASTLADSPSYCDSVKFSIPQSLAVSSREVIYTLNVSKLERISDAKPVNYLIFSVIKKSGADEKTIAASSIVTAASIQIFSAENDVIELADEADLKPSAFPPLDTILLVKEIEGGEATIYVIPCRSEGTVCEANKSAAGGIAHPESENGDFKC